MQQTDTFYTAGQIMTKQFLAKPVISYATTTQLSAALLHRLRVANNLSVEQAAERTMLAPKSWYNYEAGTYRVPGYLLNRLGLAKLRVRGFKGPDHLDALKQTLAEDYRLLVVDPWSEKPSFLQVKIATLRGLVEVETELG